ncbi:MAG: LON peptidase substrate-binding domain-containing protein, partial [Imperialibacter sp.]
MNSNKEKELAVAFLSEIQEDESGDIIQLVSADLEEDLKPEDVPDEVPILPIKNTVLYPGVVIPITVSRQKSIRLVKKAYKGSKIIGVLAQKNRKAEEPKSDDLYTVGTIARILKMLVMPDGNTTIIIQGKSRFEVESIIQEDPYISARVKLLAEKFPGKSSKETKALIQSLKDAAYKVMKLNPEIPKEAHAALGNIDNGS